MTNEELVEQIQNGVNVKENMGLLYEQNIGFITKIVHPFSAYAEEEDLMQEAYIGLHKAVCISSSVFPKNWKEKFPILGIGYSHISAGNIFI